ncbi:MAG TPA: lanthionine synthetase C family protein [Thermoanaerobaculia bacterium]|nr:lanthionine synthetase C family protein [Thermoanaerobaculia bacterium]
MNVTTGNWRPLLEGELAARAEEAVHAIADALAARALDAPDVEGRSFGFSVGNGTAGQALFYGYLAKSGNGASARHAEQSDRFLEHAVDALATSPVSPGLYGGFTGVAWLAEHLGEPDTDGDDMNEEVDETVLAMLDAPWNGHYDLITGLVGLGVYALERVPRPSAVRCLEAIVDRLHETAERLGDGGITWFTFPEMLPPRHRAMYPRGYHNLGVAHGIPAVIGFLADAWRLGIRPERARPLLEGAVRWILSRQLPEGAGGRYSTLILPDGGETPPARLAWCYGDPGVAATLLYAARATGNEEWERAALDIASHAATTAPEEAGVRDAGLCHGALGLAHMYNRFYQAGGGELFADAARSWYRQGLDMRRPERGIAGFESWELGPDMQMGWRTDPGLMTGAAGVGLALLAGLTSVEPRWDRLLMVAIPPRDRGESP